jgi:hypothetical protein
MKRSFSPHSTTSTSAAESEVHNKRQKIKQPPPPISSSSSNSMGTVVLPYIHDILQNFEQGHYDQCLKGTPPALDQLNSSERESISAIEATIKSLVERHVRLETENLRYQVAFRQQQQLLSTEAQDASQQHIQIQKEKLPINPSLLPVTPEDGIWSMKDTNVLDKVKTKANVFPPLSLSGYFCTLPLPHAIHQ